MQYDNFIKIKLLTLKFKNKLLFVDLLKSENKSVGLEIENRISRANVFQLVWRQKDNEGSPLLRERTRQVDAAEGRRNSVCKKTF